MFVALNEHAIATLLLTVVALYLFARDDLPIEVTSLVLLVTLALGFTLFPFMTEAGPLEPSVFFAGFSNEAVIAVCALMMIGQGLVQTSALEPVGRALARGWGRLPVLSLLMTLVLAGSVSAFVNNTPVVVLLLPILVGVCLRTGHSPSGVLLPMGLATIVGGMTTTIGTSTNLLVVDVAESLGMRRLEMFDFALPALAAGGVALVYLWLVAPRLLPHRDTDLSDPSPRVFEAHIEIGAASPAVGKTLMDAITLSGEKLRVLRIRRGDVALYPLPDVEIRAGDRLRISDTPIRLKRAEAALQGTLYAGEHAVDAEHPLTATGQALAEIAVVPGSSLDRVRLRDVQLSERFQLTVVALHRAGTGHLAPGEPIQDTPLAPGDVLLVQGPREQMSLLKRSAEFLVLDGTTDVPTTSRAPLALGILVAVVVLAASGVLPIAVSAAVGATVMILSRCMDLRSALRAVSPSVLLVIVASLALARALIETGATGLMTDVYLAAMRDMPPIVALAGLMLLLAILTNVVSNNAAAVIGTPIAIGVAEQLGLAPEPFVLAVLFGANMSFCTPMAYQTNLLIMAAGNYRFGDFLRVGVPLTLLTGSALVFALDAIYF